MKDTCEECKFFGKDACGRKVTDPKHEKCSDFYRDRARVEDKKEQKHPEKLSGLADQGWFESIYSHDKPGFLVLNASTFKTVDQVTAQGKIFMPRESKKIPYQPYGFYIGTVPSREELFWKIRNEIHSFIDVESIWKEVLAASVLLSYVQEKLQTVPYVFLYGDNESGKSTVLQVLKSLCYRPLYGVTIPSADIYGYLQDSEATGCILEDELQGIDKDTDKIKVYKAGYKFGAVVPRTILLQHDRVIRYYNTFCFKACASEQIPTVKGFRERFIEVAMTEGYPEKEWVDVTKDDLKRLSDLRNMLLKWRMLSRSWELPVLELEIKGRLKEIWKPLLQITHGLTVYDTLFNFIEEQRKERLSSKQNTLEGHIVKVVAELYHKQPIPLKDIWDSLVSDLEGKLDEKKPHQMDTSEFFTVTKSRIGYRLREILSGKKTAKKFGKERESVWCYEFDERKLSRVAKKYGYELSRELESYTSSQRVQPPKSMEKNDGDNVEEQAHTHQELSKLSNSLDSTGNEKNEEESTNTNSLADMKGNSLDNIKAVVSLEPVYSGTCPFCKQKKTLTWQIQYFDGTWTDACLDCGTPLMEKNREKSD